MVMADGEEENNCFGHHGNFLTLFDKKIKKKKNQKYLTFLKIKMWYKISQIWRNNLKKFEIVHPNNFINPSKKICF